MTLKEVLDKGYKTAKYLHNGESRTMYLDKADGGIFTKYEIQTNTWEPVLSEEEKLKERVKELENELQKLRNDAIITFNRNNSCMHDYPNPWNSITPPHCKKCGKQVEPWNIVTYTVDSTKGFTTTADTKPNDTTHVHEKRIVRDQNTGWLEVNNQRGTEIQYGYEAGIVPLPPVFTNPLQDLP